jgi:hypothetical protein
MKQARFGGLFLSTVPELHLRAAKRHGSMPLLGKLTVMFFVARASEHPRGLRTIHAP